jgi:hypothetical protein
LPQLSAQLTLLYLAGSNIPLPFTVAQSCMVTGRFVAAWIDPSTWLCVRLTFTAQLNRSHSSFSFS